MKWVWAIFQSSIWVYQLSSTDLVSALVLRNDVAVFTFITEYKGKEIIRVTISQSLTILNSIMQENYIDSKCSINVECITPNSVQKFCVHLHIWVWISGKRPIESYILLICVSISSQFLSFKENCKLFLKVYATWLLVIC